MKITNPSVILKDGLWHGYTVEVPEEPDYCTMTECDPYELCGCRKNKIYYEESLDSANASLVKISNQEEVEKYVRIVNAWEAYKTTDKWKPTPDAIYKLDGYVMEVTQLRSEETTGQYTKNGKYWCDECCNGDRCDDPTHLDRRSCPYCNSSGFRDFNAVATISHIQKQEPQAASFPDFEKYSAYKESKTVATSGTKYAAPDNQEELWREVDRIFNVKWSYGIPDEVMQELKDKFTITRKDENPQKINLDI